MTALVKSIATGWSFVASWLLPSGVAVGACIVIVYPDVDMSEIGKFVEDMDAEYQALAAAFVSFVIALVLANMSAALYRVLEGYVLWPKSIRVARTSSWRKKKQQLTSAHGKAGGLDQALLAEQLHRFPNSSEQVAPTRFGNAIRALEAYSHDRYLLDSQVLWIELLAVAPQAA